MGYFKHPVSQPIITENHLFLCNHDDYQSGAIRYTADVSDIKLFFWFDVEI